MIIPKIRIRKRHTPNTQKTFLHFTTSCQCPYPPKGCNGKNIIHHFCVLGIDILISNKYKDLACSKHINQYATKVGEGLVNTQLDRFDIFSMIAGLIITNEEIKKILEEKYQLCTTTNWQGQPYFKWRCNQICGYNKSFEYSGTHAKITNQQLLQLYKAIKNDDINEIIRITQQTTT